MDRAKLILKCTTHDNSPAEGRRSIIADPLPGQPGTFLVDTSQMSCEAQDGGEHKWSFSFMVTSDAAAKR